MKKNSILFVFSFFVSIISAQEVVQSYYYSDGYTILPKMILEREREIIFPFSITKNQEKKAGVLYLNKDNSIKEAILFNGEDSYVINEIIESHNGNLLVAAEGYSEEGQESLYFIELDEGGIINDFIFNEKGNELDPFAILELKKNILIGGFVKSRELVNNSFYNMYSEKQMIYVGEFTKEGEKIWSKGFDLAGYERGICNQMIKQDNSIILLCHANKIGEDMSPILIKIDFEGNIQEIVEIGKSNTMVIGGRIAQVNNQIRLVGCYKDDTSYLLFSYLFNKDLKPIESEEYEMPGRVLINSFNGNIISGSIFKDNTYNNLVINLSNNSCVLNQFGSGKTDILIGNIGTTFFGYKIGSIKGINSTLMIFNDIDSFLSVDKKKGSLSFNDNIEHDIEERFIKSSVNKGVSRVKTINVSDMILNL